MAPSTFPDLSGRYLSFEERENIAMLHAQRRGVRAIARQLGRSPSTISRELRRNAATRTGDLEYRATTAQWYADRRAARPKVATLVSNPTLRKYVQERLAGTIATATGVVTGTDVRWPVDGTVVDKIAAGQMRGAPSRSPTDSLLIFPTMSR